MEALGQYLFDFAKLEAELTVLLAYCRSAPDAEHSKRMTWEEVENWVWDKLTAGALRHEADEALTDLLGRARHAEPALGGVWAELNKQCKAAIEERNDLLHKLLPTAEELLDTEATGFIFRNDVRVDEDLLADAAQLQVLASGVRGVVVQLRLTAAAR